MFSLMQATFSNEVLYVGESIHHVHGPIHVFSVSFEISYKHNIDNILVFPVPGSELITPNQVIQVRGTLLGDELLNSIRGEKRPRLPSLECTVSLLTSANQIEEKFPGHNGISGFGSLIGEFYPGYQMLVCAFQPFEGTREFSMCAWYKPVRPDALFLPTFAGTADCVNFEKEVSTDYWAIMSTLSMYRGVKTGNVNINNEIHISLPNFVVGKKFEGWYQNADTIAAVEAIQAGLSDTIHRRPFFGLWHG